MSPGEGMRDLYAIFGRALDEAPARRAAFLATACSHRIDLRRRIARLLVLAESRGGFLERGPLQRATASEPFDSAYESGERIGAYRLIRRLGSGGMAEVWLAEHVEGGLRQRAAVKILRARDPAGAHLAGEREILAALAHPGIPKLYAGGLDARGSAYMIMEYVEGEHLIAWCNARRLGLAERLALFLEVCDAVAYAHAHRVVHRDLKPANILVAADGAVKLLDFGIAKVIGRDGASEATRMIRLSPAYAAPEQLAGGRIGTSADVHALGVILFELLTGTLPWASEASSLTLAVKRLVVTEAPAPSRAVTRDSPVAASAIAGDLDAIVGTALRREPGERHADARALADEIRRLRDRQGSPEAHAPSAS
jgi:serine/threonine-protein kinase